MAPSLLHPPSRLSAAEALVLSQRAPVVLESLPSSVSSSTLQSVVAPIDNPEVWMSYENLLLSCLRTGDVESARESLRRLVGRFGEDNDRIKALGGLVREAEAEDDKAVLAVLKSYDEILAEDGSNIVRSPLRSHSSPSHSSPSPPMLTTTPDRLSTSGALPFCDH